MKAPRQGPVARPRDALTPDDAGRRHRMLYSWPVEALVVVCHPEPRSFNHAVARRVCETLASAGWAPRFHDLYAERFDPVLAAGELRRGLSLDPLVQAHANDLEACAGLVLVHPDWWGGPPAVLKGWVDRVFRPGLAYEHEGEEFMRKQARGLLGGKRALVFATTDSPARPAALEAFWREGVFAFCGLDRNEVHVLAGLRDSSAADRAAWLHRVDGVVGAFFAGPSPAAGRLSAGA